MKKLIGLLLCFLMLSGCESLDYEMMVCKYQGMNSLYYEIRYKEDEIRDIIVVEYLNLKDVPEQVYKERLDYFEKLQKIMERYAGIDAYLENGLHLTGMNVYHSMELPARAEGRTNQTRRRLLHISERR